MDAQTYGIVNVELNFWTWNSQHVLKKKIMIIIQNVGIIIFIIVLTLPCLRPPPSPSQTSDSRELLSSFAGAELVQTSQRQKNSIFFAETEFLQTSQKTKNSTFFTETELVQTFQRQKTVFFC